MQQKKGSWGFYAFSSPALPPGLLPSYLALQCGTFLNQFRWFPLAFSFVFLIYFALIKHALPPTQRDPPPLCSSWHAAPDLTSLV